MRKGGRVGVAKGHGTSRLSVGKTSLQHEKGRMGRQGTGTKG